VGIEGIKCCGGVVCDNDEDTAGDPEVDIDGESEKRGAVGADGRLDTGTEGFDMKLTEGAAAAPGKPAEGDPNVPRGTIEGGMDVIGLAVGVNGGNEVPEDVDDDKLDVVPGIFPVDRPLESVFPANENPPALEVGGAFEGVNAGAAGFNEEENTEDSDSAWLFRRLLLAPMGANAEAMVF